MLDARSNSDDLQAASYGGTAISGIFELRAPAQMRLHTAGRCATSKGSRLSTMLQNLTTHRNLVVAGAEVGSGHDIDFVIESTASLRLEAGLYAWVTEIVPPAGGQVTRSQLNGDVVSTGKLFLNRGVHEVFALISGTEHQSVSTECIINCRLKAGEVLTGTLGVTDMNTNQQLETQPIHAEGPQNSDIETRVSPYFLTAGRNYRALLQVNYQGSTPLTCLLKQAV